MQRFALTLSLALSGVCALKTGTYTSPKVPGFARSHLHHKSCQRTQDACDQYTKDGAAAPAECQKKHCMPQCKYHCTDPQCDQVCTPECLAPECQTRCPRLDIMNMRDAGCRVSCIKPVCEVVCPQKHCGHEGCVECKTVCHKPQCKVTCPDHQCQEVCKQPKCKFNCAKSDVCPEPVCKMTCEGPGGCMSVEDGLPPLQQGMTIVNDFDPAAAAAAPVAAAAGAASPAAAAAAAEEEDDSNPELGAIDQPGDVFLATQKSLPQVDPDVETMAIAAVTAVSAPGSKELELKHVNIDLPVDDGCN